MLQSPCGDKGRHCVALFLLPQVCAKHSRGRKHHARPPTEGMSRDRVSVQIVTSYPSASRNWLLPKALILLLLMSPEGIVGQEEKTVPKEWRLVQGLG